MAVDFYNHNHFVMLKRKIALLLCSVLTSSYLLAQTNVTVSINNADDDLEERLAGPTQTKVVGSLDNGSSDIELGTESSGNDPQLVGLRFNNITIPKGALILRAYLQFTVDEINKNTDPCNVWVKVQASDNAPAFNTGASFNISSRAMVADSVNWVVGSWPTIGASQISQDISKLVQHVVDRSGWSSGNSMVFTIKGTGTREAESYESGAATAPKLVIDYIMPQMATFPISAADNDQEEWLTGSSQGTLDAGSSDLELGTENSGSDPQVVGVRFTNITIPKGAYIKSAYLQFTVDATSKNTDPCNLWIKVQDADNPVIFNPSSNFNITSRAKLNDSVAWNIPAGSWNNVGQAGPDEKSTNIARLLQAIVDRNGWSSGNSVVFFIHGTGTREAESYDGSAADAPKLIVEYAPTASVTIPVGAADDDQEEWLSGTSMGTLDAGSSDLEFGTENSGSDPQMVGIRFNNINLAKGTMIKSARIRFTVDATSKNADPVNVWIKAQDADNPVIFNPSSNFNITSRAKLKDSVNWIVPAGTWTAQGQSGPDQTTSDIKNLVQALVNRTGWSSGNAMAFFIHGTGTREAESYDGSAPDAPKLIIDYISTGPVVPPPPPINPAVNYPLPTKTQWSYLDTGSAPNNWKDLNFNDTPWVSGKGALGYKAADLGTTIGYGKDSTKKHITTYYRKRLNIADVSALPNNLEVQLRADDGAVLYVNGTEVLKVNMPTSGAITNTTTATADVKAPNQDVYFTYEIPKTSFVTGMNILAVEVHQFAANSEDHVFDMALLNPVGVTNPTDLGCTAAIDSHIGCFTSLMPRPQNDTFQIPSATHVFQFLAQTGDPFTQASGTVPSNFDFTGYVPINDSSKYGYVNLNHERGAPTGGVTTFALHFNDTTGLWKVDNAGPVNFSPVVATGSNCSGGVTPWGTSITCEETYPSTGDANGDGYIDYGWHVEVDPKTRQVKDFGNGPEKLWALGRMSHENIVVSKDRKTAYFGEDDGLGAVYKFVAKTAGNLSEGDLYVLKLDQPMASGEPTGTTGKWIKVPNTTKTERNNVKINGSAMGTTFSGVEDVEINPVDNQIYFTAKGLNRVYRFKENGDSTISGFMTYVGGKTYRISSGSTVISEPWGSGNDNLVFDDRGNLWVLQDGSRNHVWIVRPGHTQANPKIEVFMHLPAGSEPTGATFTPDYRYMFISIQEPSTNINANVRDVAGVYRTMNKSTMMVIARKEFLGVSQLKPPVDTTDTTNSVQIVKNINDNVRIYPNPFTSTATVELNVVNDNSDIMIQLVDIAGKTIQAIQPGRLQKGSYKYTVSAPVAGFYFCNVTIDNVRNTYKIIKQ